MNLKMSGTGIKMKGLFSLFLVTYYQGVFSQCTNLVSNPGFDIHSGCPTGTSQLYLANLWTQPTKGTPDYFHSCSQVPGMDVPNNQNGYQPARSDSAYAGFYVYGKGGSTDHYREYVSIQLLPPMVKNKTYYVEMYVSLAGKSQLAVDQIGALFSVNPMINFNSEANIIANPQITSPNGVFLTDTMAWMKISGKFIADLAYRYLTIGNFSDNSATDTIVVKSFPTGVNPSSYYYIDDVTVIEDTIFNVSSISICTGESATLSVVPVQGDTYSWSTNEITSSIVVDPLVDSMYVLQTTNGDCVFIDSFAVDVSPFPTIYANVSDNKVCKSDAVIFTAIGADTYRWYSASNGRVISSQDSFSTFADNDYYFVIGSIKGCESSDTVFMDIVDCSPALYYPNSFTPNGDGLNDVFRIQSSLIQSIYVKIYNRWGNEIHSWNDIEGSWDGRLNGELLSEDIYVLSIVYLTNNNDEHQKIDRLLLMR